MLEISSLRVMVKRSRGKKQQEETEKQQHVIVTENNLLMILLQKVFEITTESSPTSLEETVDGAADQQTVDGAASFGIPQEEFQKTPLHAN